jgi:hypothetical protein
MSRHEPSRKRRRIAQASWDECPIAAEAAHMDALLRAQGYERARHVRIFLRASGLMTCRYVWRHRDAGASLSLTITEMRRP